MIKAMLFIDGSWLYANLPELGKVYGKPDFQIDFGKLPTVLAEDVAEQAGIGAVDLVRTYYFASYAENYDLRDMAAVQRRMAFFSRLKEDYNYEVEAFGINYQGRRLRRVDRDPGDDFVPKEKCVDISLAITVMHYATVPGAMDVAILLIGDRDFVPLLQDIRRRGIRVAVASIYGSCAQELADPADAARVRDFDVIWLNDALERIEYTGDEQQQHAAAQPGGGGAAGARRVWTTNVPRWGRRSYWAVQRDELMMRVAAEACAPSAAEALDAPGVGEVLRGRIKNIIWDRGFGFIASEGGPDYFFHANTLEDGLTFDELQPDMAVVFEVKTPPTPMRAGAALSVRRDTGTAAASAAEATATTAEPPDDSAAAAAGIAENTTEGEAPWMAEGPPCAAGDGAGIEGDDGGPVAGGEEEDTAAERSAAGAAAADPTRTAAAGVGEVLRGRIKNVIWERGFGFIASESGPDYFFHANGLMGDLTFEALQPGLAVVFQVRTRPTTMRAGAALYVRRDISMAVGGGPAAVDTPDAGGAPACAAEEATDTGAAEEGPTAGTAAAAAAEEADDENGEEGPREAQRGTPTAAAETLDFSTASAAPGRQG